jgi:hypothetical protein
VHAKVACICAARDASGKMIHRISFTISPLGLKWHTCTILAHTYMYVPLQKLAYVMLYHYSMEHRKGVLKASRTTFLGMMS